MKNSENRVVSKKMDTKYSLKKNIYVLVFYFTHAFRPAKLLDVVKKRFIALGGALFEARSLSNIAIYDDAAVRQLSFSFLGSQLNFMLYALLQHSALHLTVLQSR